jgi:NAD(P)H-hydrate epimerase
MDARFVTAEQMKELDRYTIEVMGVPAMVLMERAALASVETLHKGEHKFDLKNVLCVCGAGNNGGDGFAVSRLLKLQGVRVRALFIGSVEKMTQETALQKMIAGNYDVEIVSNDLEVFNSGGGYTTVIDALFGIGGDRPLTGIYLETVRRINRLSGNSSAKILSLDIPSGISANTGTVLGEGVRANVTVTFAFNKVGLTLEPGKTYAGETVVKDIGIYRP